jgi:excisionase family DNA binding protein
LTETRAIHLAVPAELVEAIAEAVIPVVLERLADLELANGDHPDYLTVTEAAAFLRAKPQRVYDLLSSRRLQRFKDGARVLVSRVELEAYLAGGVVALPLPPGSQSRMGRRLTRRGAD